MASRSGRGGDVGEERLELRALGEVNRPISTIPSHRPGIDEPGQR